MMSDVKTPELTQDSSLKNELKSSSSYFQRHLRPLELSEADNRRIENMLFTPLGEVSYNQKGKVQVNRNGLDLTFSYKPLPKDIDPDIKEMLKESGRLSKFRMLQDITLKNDTSSLELTRVLPPGTTVFFNPFRKSFSLDDDHINTTDPLTKTIITEGDPTMPGAIFTILHEAGHLVTLEGNTSDNIERYMAAASALTLPFISIDDPEAELVLKNERNAWAFALRKIKPFLQVDDSLLIRKCLRDFIHGACLKSYESIIESNLSPEGL